ncbi:MAG: tyrosine-type recombinase/integrase [Proteobacteria bacterium]|nr:tyrosine-type recombinase/integrase [Pseudomonadota bacterium]
MSEKRTFEFTDRALKGLPIPPKPQQLDYFDAKARGLGLRISYGGRRSFFAMYSNAAGKRQRVSLGEYGRLEDGKLSLAEARKRAKAKLGEVAKDRDPAAEVRAVRSAPTVRELAADFIAMQCKMGRKSATQQEERLNRDVLPALGNRKARDVRRGHIKTLLSEITERPAPVLANRVHEIIRAMFNFGIDEEVYGLENNPADRLGKHRNPEQARDRWLTLDEIRAYWQALDEELPGPAAGLRLCLLTGQRRQNVLGMRLEQLALEDRLWIVPARTTKTKKPYKVPLSTAVVAIIQARILEVEEAEQMCAKREHREPQPVTWLFPNKRTGEGPASRTFTGRAHRLACKRAGIADYTPHDHRHTFATHCEQMGISRLIWDGIMGHSANGMADLYSGYDFAEQRLDCMERWADRIAAAMGDNVVSLDRSREKPA